MKYTFQYLNTSHVNVNHFSHGLSYLDHIHLNTSHVNVNPYAGRGMPGIFLYLNTSHVNVNRFNISLFNNYW